MHDSTQQPPTHPPIPPKALHYVNLLQEEPQQHFYNIHQNTGKACVRVACDVLPAERLWSLNTIVLTLKARRERYFSEQLESKCWLLKRTVVQHCVCQNLQLQNAARGGDAFPLLGNEEKRQVLGTSTWGEKVAERFRCEVSYPDSQSLLLSPCASAKAAHYIRRLAVNAVWKKI